MWGTMQNYEFAGLEIVVIGARWEIFDDDGNLLADGPGGTSDAVGWIEHELRLVNELLALSQPRCH